RGRQARGEGPRDGAARARAGRSGSLRELLGRGTPARERDVDDSRTADAAPDVELTTEHPNPLADSDQPEPSVLRGADHRRLDVEALAVVFDLHADLSAAPVDRHARRGRFTVLADVGETLLDDAVDRDSLRGGEPFELAAELEVHAGGAARLELLGLRPEDL